MKLIYIANIRLPTEKAHGIQIIEMCSAFADCGIDVKLIVPRRINQIKENPFKYYNIKKNFSISRLPCLDFVNFGRVGFLLELATFSISVFFYSLFNRGNIFYTRDELLAVCLKILGKKVVWEGHTGQTNLIIRILIFFKIPIVVITKSLRDLYISFGVAKDRIIVAPDGVDIERFDITISKNSARKKLGLPLDKKIVLYKGHLYKWKGVEHLARAMAYLKDKNILCVFIGGTERDIKYFKKEFGDKENIFILGHKPRKETPVYQKASDVLIVPNSAENDVSKLYTSPMKLFGYMASNIPIVASDLPSLREVLNEENSILVQPDNPKALADGIEKILTDGNLSKNISKEAYMNVNSYTWKKRAKKIIRFTERQ